MRKAVLGSLLALAIAGSAFGAGPVAGAGAKGAPANLGFDLEIRLSKQATHELARRKEGLTVSASYYGDPTPAGKRHANQVGLIDLGQESFTLRGISGPARVTGATVDRKRLGWIAGPPMVNVNIFTSRRSSPDNLVTCDIIDGPVARVAKARTVLACGLIAEKRDAAVFPR